MGVLQLLRDWELVWAPWILAPRVFMNEKMRSMLLFVILSIEEVRTANASFDLKVIWIK